MSCRSTLSFAAAALLAVPMPALGQALEGVIRQRTLDLEEDALYGLIYAESENEPDFETEADWLRFVAGKLLPIPIDDLTGGQESDLTVHIRGTMLRYEDASTGGYVITDLSTMTTRMVDPSTRSYVEVSAEDAQAAADEAARQAEEMMARMGVDPEEVPTGDMDDEYGDEEGGVRFTPRVRAVGRTEQVNGHTAEVFEAEAGSEIGMGWCAEDPTGMRAAMEHVADQVVDFAQDEDALEDEGPLLEDLLCQEGIPVRTKILRMGSWGGFAYSVTEILSMERTSVSPDIFEIPAGYTKKAIEDLWR